MNGEFMDDHSATSLSELLGGHVASYTPERDAVWGTTATIAVIEGWVEFSLQLHLRFLRTELGGVYTPSSRLHRCLWCTHVGFFPYFYQGFTARFVRGGTILCRRGTKARAYYIEIVHGRWGNASLRLISFLWFFRGRPYDFYIWYTYQLVDRGGV